MGLAATHNEAGRSAEGDLEGDDNPLPRRALAGMSRPPVPMPPSSPFAAFAIFCRASERAGALVVLDHPADAEGANPRVAVTEVRRQKAEISLCAPVSSADR